MKFSYIDTVIFEIENRFDNGLAFTGQQNKTKILCYGNLQQFQTDFWCVEYNSDARLLSHHIFVLSEYTSFHHYLQDSWLEIVMMIADCKEHVHAESSLFWRSCNSMFMGWVVWVFENDDLSTVPATKLHKTPVSFD